MKTKFARSLPSPNLRSVVTNYDTVGVCALVPSTNSIDPSRSMSLKTVLKSAASFAWPFFAQISLMTFDFNSAGYSICNTGFPALMNGKN